jgi:anti-anti-sigma factor
MFVNSIGSTSRAERQALVVDCSNVQLLGTEILGALLVLERRLRQKNARLVLCGLPTEVREVLSWTRLDRFFEINKDESMLTAARAHCD